MQYKAYGCFSVFEFSLLITGIALPPKYIVITLQIKEKKNCLLNSTIVLFKL